MKSLIEYISESLSTPNNAKAFTIIKPGFISHTNEIYDYIISKGFIMHDHIDNVDMTDQQIKTLYSCHKNKPFYNDLCKYMGTSPVNIACWCYDHERHPNTNTISLMKEIKNHFREKYGQSDMKNCMHSSDSLDNVQRESNIFFN